MTDRQQRFVEAYLIDPNATKAAEAAGYSKKTAQEQGSRLLSNVMVAEAIKKAQGERAEKAGITAERVLNELALLGFARAGDYIRVTNEGDPYIDLSACTPEQLAAVSEVTCEDYRDGRGEDARDVRKVKVKFYDKRAALVDIGKHLGMFVDRVDHTTGGEPFAPAIFQLPDNARNPNEA